MSEPSCLSRVPAPLFANGRLYRVARPGRGLCGPDKPVSEIAIRTWLDGVRSLVAGANEQEPVLIHYVCLLGWKKGGKREIAGYYPARQPDDPPDNRPTFEQLLNDLANGRMLFQVHHFPTEDHVAVPPEIVSAVRDRVSKLLDEGRVVLVGCSAGQSRTGTIVNDPAWLTP